MGAAGKDSGCNSMRVGLIDVDGHNFPNIPLMKLSAWHKQQGDTVEWYEPLFSGHMNRVYMSKVFSFTQDYPYFVDADEVVRGGSGYCIELTDGREHYQKERDKELPPEVEHIYPDYMVLGSTINNKQGKLLFFKSTDKKNWTYMNFVTKDNGFGWMWECPDYFQTDGEQILIFSPMDFNKGGKSYSDQSICMKVMFQKETCHMEMPDTYQYLDYGLDLYAPQTTVDEAGRRVLLAWLRMPKPVDGQWSGMQCIPRVIEVKNDHIYFRVHPNIRNAFSKKINSPDEADENGYRVSFSLEDGETVDIGGYQITRKGNKIHTDRGRLVDTSWEMQTEFSTPDLKDGFQIDVYVDPNLIEVFVNDGEYIISNCVYNLGTDIHQQGNVKYEMYTLEGTDVSEV